VRDLVSGARGREVYATGDTDRGIWWTGIAQGLIHDVPRVAALIERTVIEADQIIRDRLSGALGEPTKV
jgi:nitronate monooxygenase